MMENTRTNERRDPSHETRDAHKRHGALSPGKAPMATMSLNIILAQEEAAHVSPLR
jgi:hypothetical protein